MTRSPTGTFHAGMMPSHPGAIVREDILAPLNLSVSAAAKVLGVRRATLSDLLNEKAALSPEMALRIELAFGVQHGDAASHTDGMGYCRNPQAPGRVQRDPL